MKKGALGLGFIAIMLISFVSAQFGYGFSLSNFLYSVDSSSLILLLLFIVFFTILNNIVFITFFRGNKSVSAIVSFSISTMAIWGINRMQWNLGNFFFNLGLNEDTLYTIVLVVLLVLFVYLAFKKRLRYLFLGLGLLLTGLAAFSDFFFEWFTAFIIGLVLIILWWIGARRAKRKESPYYGGPGYSGAKTAWKHTKTFGRGTKTAGKGVWKAGKNTYEGYQKYKNWRDPREKLARYKKSEEEKEDKLMAERRLKTEQEKVTQEIKAADKELKLRKDIEKAHKQAIKENQRRFKDEIMRK